MVKNRIWFIKKKNNTVILWRAAAVFVLCGLLTGAWFYWQSTQKNTQQLVANQEDINKALPEPQKPVVEPIEEQKNKNQVTVIRKSPHTKRENITSSINNDEVKEPVQISKEIEELIAVSETTTMVSAPKAERPIVIEFTLEPIPAKVLVSQTSDEKSNGLKKILDKAIDLKNGEGDLGSIRDAKNELFALDFKKDKTKRN